MLSTHDWVNPKDHREVQKFLREMQGDLPRRIRGKMRRAPHQRAGTNYVLAKFDREGGRLIDLASAFNLVTTVGVNTLLNATFAVGLASPAWYLGMIAGGSTPTFTTSDVMASHAGWSEIVGSNVTQTTRQAWTPGTVSGGIVSNSSSSASYTIASGSPTLQGLFMVDNNTLAGSTGNLYSEAVFDEGAQTTVTGNVIVLVATLQIVAG